MILKTKEFQGGMMMFSTDNPLNTLVYVLVGLAVGGYAIYRITQYMGDVLDRISKKYNVAVVSTKLSLPLALAVVCWGLLVIFILYGDGGGSVATAFRSGVYPYVLVAGGVFPFIYAFVSARSHGLSLGETLLVIVGNMFRGLMVVTAIFAIMSVLNGGGNKRSRDSGRR